MAAVVIAVVAPVTAAFATQVPDLVPYDATFVIPAHNPATTTWALNVWSNGKLVGTDAGTSGMLKVEIPRTTHGVVQADVRRNDTWYVGATMKLPDDGSGGHGGHGHGGHGHGGHGHGGHGHGGGGTTPTTTTTVPSKGDYPVTLGGSGATRDYPVTLGGSGATRDYPVALGGSGATGPATTADGSTPRTGPSSLAFTGTGTALWTVAMSGSVLVLVGLSLLARRRARAARP